MLDNVKVTVPVQVRGSASPNVFFTSDTHYGHANIIKYAERPFANVQAMGEAMIYRWNSVVKPGDLVYHLGDFCLGRPDQATSIAKRLMGQKFLIWGNHDKRLRKDKEFCEQWVWTKDLHQVEQYGQKIVLCHYAMRTWAGAHRGTWQFYGHSHGSLKEWSTSVDVGVDCWDFTPVSFETLRDVMKNRKFIAVDHHGED